MPRETAFMASKTLGRGHEKGWINFSPKEQVVDREGVRTGATNLQIRLPIRSEAPLYPSTLKQIKRSKGSALMGETLRFQSHGYMGGVYKPGVRRKQSNLLRGSPP